MAHGTLVDSNVLLDVMTEDPLWLDWSSSALVEAAEAGPLFINPVVFAEVSVRFTHIEDLDDALPASFLAGKVFLEYRRNQGPRPSVLPDFFIGAHAAVSELRLLTRDTARYRAYFPTVLVMSPDPRPE